MKQRVIKLTESDIERLISKIIKEGEINEKIGIESIKKTDLSGGVADIRNIKRLVVLNKDGRVVAIGPEVSTLKGYSKERICRIIDNLIEDLFFLDEGVINEVDHGDVENIQSIKYCSR